VSDTVITDCERDMRAVTQCGWSESCDSVTHCGWSEGCDSVWHNVGGLRAVTV